MVLEILKCWHSLPKKAVFLSMILLWSVGYPSKAASEAERDFVRVAIVPFVNISGIEDRDTWGYCIANTMFTSRLSSVKGIMAYKPSGLMIHLKQLDKTPKDCTTKEVVLALGKRCAADWVMYGTLGGKDEEIDVSIKLLEIAKNQEQMLYSGKMDESGLLELDIILSKKLVEVLQLKEVTISSEKATDKKKAFEYLAKGCHVLNEASVDWSYSSPEQYQEALKWFESSTKEDIKYSEAYIAIACCANVLGQIKYDSEYYNRAIKSCDKALQLSSDDLLALIMRGYAKILNNSFDEGIDDLRKAQKINPDCAAINCFIGYGLLKKGDYDKAIIYYRNEEKLCPKDPETQNCLGHLLMDMGKSQEAVKHFNTAIEIVPDYALAYANLGACFADNGDTELATIHFKKALNLNSKLKETHNNLGVLYLRTQKIDLAEKEFECVLELDPKDIQAHCGLSSVFLANNNMDKAVEILFSLTSDIKNREEVVSRFGTGLELWNSSQALTIIGNELFFKRKLLESEKCLLEAIFIWPDNGLAMLYLGRLWMAVDRIKFGAPMINGGCQRVITMPDRIFAGILLEAKQQGAKIADVSELKHEMINTFKKYLPQEYRVSLVTEEEQLLTGLILIMGHVEKGIEPYNGYDSKVREIWKIRLRDFYYNLETIPPNLKKDFKEMQKKAGHEKK